MNRHTLIRLWDALRRDPTGTSAAFDPGLRRSDLYVQRDADSGAAWLPNREYDLSVVELGLKASVIYPEFTWVAADFAAAVRRQGEWAPNGG